MARKDKKKKGNTINIDFSGVESNTSMPEGNGRFQVIEVNQRDNDGDGTLVWKWLVTGFDDKKFKGKKFTDYTNLASNSLWNLRNRLEALGLEIPDEPSDIDLDDLVGLELEASIKHSVSGDKTYINLTNYLPAGESDAEEDDEEEVVVVKSKKSARDEDEDEEDEKPRKKSKKVVDEDDEEEDEKPKKKSKKVVEDEEDDLDEDEEDESPKKKSKKGDTYSEDDVRGLDEKGLKSLIKKHDLDVDLEDFGNLRKRQMAVIDALEEAGLLAE